MARKDVLQAFKLLTDQALDADFASEVVNIRTIDNVAVVMQCDDVTDNVGTFQIEWRAFKEPNHYSEWIELDLSGEPTLADADDLIMINLNQLPPGQIRVTFTSLGGTPDGTCTVWVTGCSVGG